MGLPEWATPPGPTFEHNENYSDLEVVWTATDTGEVLVQTRIGLIGPFGESVGEAGIGHLDILAEIAEVRASANRNTDDLKLFDEAHLRIAQTHGDQLRHLRVRWVPAAAAVGAIAGVLGVHFLPWHV